MTEEKTKTQLLKEKLFFEPKNGGIRLTEEEIGKAFEFCENYKKFLTECKTEREVVAFAVEEAKKRGFKPFDAALAASRLMKRAGEAAWARAKSPGSFRTALIDAIWELGHD